MLTFEHANHKRYVVKLVCNYQCDNVMKFKTVRNVHMKYKTNCPFYCAVTRRT